MNILQLLQQYIDTFVESNYSEDTACPPKFIVSVYEQSLIVTCVHGGSCFSEKLFPEQDMTYGLSDLDSILVSLYNRTM